MGTKSNKRYPVRIHLKTRCEKRPGLIDFCLGKHPANCRLAIGWSCVHKENGYGEGNFIPSFGTFYELTQKSVYKEQEREGKRHSTPPVLNKFKDAEIDDLFWTRDLDGMYWICRVIGSPVSHYDKKLDIGAYLPVEAYSVGDEVPGALKASFNRGNGGTSARIEDETVLAYSQYQFNKLSNTRTYKISKSETSKQDILSNLPDLDLEELVITYIQIMYDYYLSSGSIAKRSTTEKIECYFYKRHDNGKLPKRAVAQVKGGDKAQLDAQDFKCYADKGNQVFLFAPHVDNENVDPLVCAIKRDELRNFYFKNKKLLPDSITQWEDIFS